jgi:hypothetical protein
MIIVFLYSLYGIIFGITEKEREEMESLFEKGEQVIVSDLFYRFLFPQRPKAVQKKKTKTKKKKKATDDDDDDDDDDKKPKEEAKKPMPFAVAAAVITAYAKGVNDKHDPATDAPIFLDFVDIKKALATSKTHEVDDAIVADLMFCVGESNTESNKYLMTIADKKEQSGLIMRAARIEALVSGVRSLTPTDSPVVSTNMPPFIPVDPCSCPPDTTCVRKNVIVDEH